MLVPHSRAPVLFSKTAREGSLEFEKVKTKTTTYAAIQKFPGKREAGIVHCFHGYRCNLPNGDVFRKDFLLFSRRWMNLMIPINGIRTTLHWFVFRFRIAIFIISYILKIITVHALIYPLEGKLRESATMEECTFKQNLNS